jgi:hypothetical protein
MDQTAIMIILDESPSMENCTDETIQGFNIYLTEQKKDPKPATLSLIKFDRTYRVEYIDKPLAEAPELTALSYKPGGAGTALYDSVGRGILELGKRLAAKPDADRPDKVIVVIITDGQENSSREFDGNRVREMVKEQTEKYSWTFVFLGADIDAEEGAATLGIAPSAAAKYKKGTGVGTYSVLSNATSRARGGSGGVLRSAGLLSTQDKKSIESGTKPGPR